MHILGLLNIIVVAAFVLHVIRTGRDSKWIYIIIFAPLIGILVYVFSEILPDLRQSRQARRMKTGLVKAIDPLRDIRELKEQLQISDTQENRLALADACMADAQYEEAIQLYQSCLKREPHEPQIMLKLAQAYFETSAFAKVKETLDELIESNPDFKSADGHLLYARALYKLALVEPAKKEYEALISYFPGEEARCRYALLLKEQGEGHRAAELFDEVLLRSKRSPKFYRTAQREWINLARQHI